MGGGVRCKKEEQWQIRGIHVHLKAFKFKKI